MPWGWLCGLGLFAVVLYGFSPPLMGEPSGVETFPKAELELVLPGGLAHRFSVELAMTRPQIMQGLMFRETLPERSGMLFDYGVETHVSMWMKNTLVPLDMLFADGQGVVVHVVENTVPLSTERIRPPVRVRYVLEIPAGTASSLGIGPGARFATVSRR